MRRYTFYLSIALLAFGIGSFVVFGICWKTVEPSSSIENSEFLENHTNVKNEDTKIKYGCKDEELVSFWEKLDKDAFLQFKKREIKIRNVDAAFTSYPNSDDSFREFEKDWNNFQTKFNCAYFSGIEDEVGWADLNNDGEKEIFVIGEFSRYHGEKELFVFQKKKDVWKLILFDVGNEETRIRDNKTNGHFDIETKTSFSGGNRSIDTFRFNGKNYEERNCLSENTVIKKANETIVVDKPVVFREKCYREFSNILKNNRF